MNDHETVLLALKRFRKLTGSLRRGGLGPDYELAGQALDAFERLTDDSPVQATFEEYEVPGCTCRLVVALPDGSRFYGGIDACPVHGFGPDG